jgi:porin
MHKSASGKPLKSTKNFIFYLLVRLNLTKQDAMKRLFPVWRPCAAAAVVLLLGLPSNGVMAQQPQSPNTQGSDLLTSPTLPKPAAGMFERDLLTGDWGGTRTALADRGVTLGVIYTGEVFGNPVGGVRKGMVYDGLLELDLDVDFEKLAHWTGAKFHANAFEIHGASGTDKYVGDFGTFSNIDFYDSFRLFELWFEQEAVLPHFGKLSLRLGQLASDKEFYGSEVSALFINSDFGALPTLSANMPVPIYAIAAPGVRLRYDDPSDVFYFQAAVFDGNPDPDTLGNPSPNAVTGTTYNHSGARINLNSKEGAFSIYEAGYRLNQGKDAKGLPGTYKLGGWYHTDDFSDLRYDTGGRRLADPASNGTPRSHSGNYGGYLVIDQAVYRPPQAEAPSPKDGKDGKGSGKATTDAEAEAEPGGVTTEKGLYVFLRVSGAPSDRNTISLYLDGGASYRGLIPGRDKDLLGLGVSYAKFGEAARRSDRDARFFSGVALPERDQEIVVEASYQAVLAPWWSVQPDLQAIFHPGGSSAINDALVLGVRSVVSF